jgi:hypothetical protein
MYAMSLADPDNPYKSPMKDVGTPATGRAGGPSMPTLAVIFVVCSIIGFVSSPADPISMFVAVLVLALLGVGCYLLGVRHGQRAAAEPTCSGNASVITGGARTKSQTDDS